mmetsp:Transcript_9073/g.13545  ORF Transcript_9073/g.13545 Transcript_9073/m.13545 type:complete len:134 (+) Transcript_9073:4830-5231(+)
MNELHTNCCIAGKMFERGLLPYLVPYAQVYVEKCYASSFSKNLAQASLRATAEGMRRGEASKMASGHSIDDTNANLPASVPLVVVNCQWRRRETSLTIQNANVHKNDIQHIETCIFNIWKSNFKPCTVCVTTS